MEIYIYPLRCMSCSSPIEKYRVNYVKFMNEGCTSENALNKLDITAECCRIAMINGTKFSLLSVDTDVMCGYSDPKNISVNYDLDKEASLGNPRHKSFDLVSDNVPNTIGIPTQDDRYDDLIEIVKGEEIVKTVGYSYLAR